MALRACRTLYTATVAATSSSQSKVAGRVARVTFSVSDVQVAAAFYEDALGFRHIAPHTASRAVLGDAALGSCQVGLIKSTDEAPLQSPSLSPYSGRPYLTVAVSNLVTACRHARRRGGSVGAYCARTIFLPVCGWQPFTATTIASPIAPFNPCS